MGPIKEWFCADHGDFEGSHPICPALGCASREVIRVFKTAPKVKSDATKRFDAGLKETAAIYKQSDVRSAKPGESSKANVKPEGVLWGDAAKEFMGRPLTQGFAPVTYDIPGKGAWTDRGGIVSVANETPIMKNVLPPAQKIGALGDNLKKQGSK